MHGKLHWDPAIMPGMAGIVLPGERLQVWAMCAGRGEKPPWP
jgi:hypothetical protein